MIELTDVCRTYETGEGVRVRALRQVDLEIERGELVAIVGPSGSGKTSLMNILGLLDRPDEGRYRFDGLEVSSLAVHELAGLRNRSIGFVFQAFHLLPRTSALENVELPLLYGSRKGPRSRARAALEAVGLGDRLQHRPHELSGGQQQRVAIARAIVGEPDLLLADEPTGNLDSQASEQIMQLLCERHAAGTTVVIITHDEALARRASRRFRIVDGAIMAEEAGLGAQGALTR